MAMSERGAVSLVVNGKTYTLEMTINGIVALEELLSTNEKPVTFGDVLARVNAGSIRHLRAFVWAALREHHKEITLEGTGTLIQDVGGLDGLASQLLALTGSTTPDARDIRALGVETVRPQKGQAKRRGGNGGVFTSMPGAPA
jgi:hypothetical protein